MPRTRSVPAVAGLAAAGLLAGTLSAGAQGMTHEEVVAATSMAEEWVDGKLPNTVEVTYDGPPIAYRYASYLPAVSGVEKLNVRALEQLERESNGKISVQTFFGASLHPQAEAFTAVRDGIADYSACFMIYEPTSFHLMHGLTLPFLFDDSAAATMATVGIYPEYLKSEYENMGVYMGRQMITTPYNVIGNHAYRTLDDLRGSKIRAGGRMQSASLRALGAVPINVPSSEAYTALQRGMVDGVAMNDPVFPVFKLDEVSRYHNEVSLFSVNLEYCLSTDWFDSLPDDLKQVYYHWAQKTNLAIAQLFYEREEPRARAGFVERGIELVRPGGEELARWEELVAPVTQEWIDTNEAAGRPATAMLNELERLRDHYATVSFNDQFKEVYERPLSGIIGF